MKNSYIFMFRTKDGKRVRRVIYAYSTDEAWKNADDYAYDHNFCDYKFVSEMPKKSLGEE